MSVKVFGPWSLSASESARLDGYQRLRDLTTKDAEKHDKLYQRDKAEALELMMQTGKVDRLCIPQLYVNLPDLVARCSADLVLSQPPIITGESDEITARIEKIRVRSNLDAVMWRGIYWTSILADTFLVIEDKKSRTSAAPVIKLRRALGTVARNIRPQDSDEVRQLLTQTMLGDVELFMLYKARAIETYAYKKGKNGDYESAPLPTGYVPVLDTKEDAPLFVHMGSLRGDDSDENFGESDIQDTDELAFEIANRLRQTQKILDKHAEPIMNVPEGTLDDKGVLKVRTSKVFESDVKGTGASYVTWQSQLQEGYAEIDRLLRLIALITETPTTLWGLDSNGDAESGRALKFRLLTGLGKARRTGTMLRSAIAAAVRLALRREDILNGTKPESLKDYQVKVQLSDTFIADELETADNVAKLRAAGAMSVVEAVRQGQGKSGQELDNEVAAIRAENPDELGFERDRDLGGDPDAKFNADPNAKPDASLKEGEVPVDTNTPVEPLEINGAVVQGIIELVRTELMTVEQALERLGLPKPSPERLEAIKKRILAAVSEGQPA